MSDRRRVWIAEPNFEGHRLFYVRLLLEAASGREIDIEIVTTSEARHSQEWVVHLDGTQARVLERQTYWPTLLEVSERWGIALVVVPDADRALLDLVRRWPYRSRLRLSALLMRGTSGAGMGLVARHAAKVALVAAMRMASRGRADFLTLEATIGQQWAGWHWLGVRAVEDPVHFGVNFSDAEDWRRAQGVQSGAKLFLVIGDVSERKCVKEILTAWSNVPADHVLALVGSVDSAVRATVDALSPEVARKVFIRDGYLPDQEFDNWIAAADAVFVLHRNEGSSGVLLKALAAGTPVIAGGATNVVDRARSAGPTSTVVERLTPPEIAAAVKEHRRRGAPVGAVQPNSEFGATLLDPAL